MPSGAAVDENLVVPIIISSSSMGLHPPLQDYMSQFQDLQYCKTDLIATKGVVFCKFARASSALYAMELINETSIVRHRCLFLRLLYKHHCYRWLATVSNASWPSPRAKSPSQPWGCRATTRRCGSGVVPLANTHITANTDACWAAHGRVG